MVYRAHWTLLQYLLPLWKRALRTLLPYPTPRGTCVLTNWAADSTILLFRQHNHLVSMFTTNSNQQFTVFKIIVQPVKLSIENRSVVKIEQHESNVRYNTSHAMYLQLLFHLIDIPRRCFCLTTPLGRGLLGFRASQLFTEIHAHSFLYTGPELLGSSLGFCQHLCSLQDATLVTAPLRAVLLS